MKVICKTAFTFIMVPQCHLVVSCIVLGSKSIRLTMHISITSVFVHYIGVPAKCETSTQGSISAAQKPPSGPRGEYFFLARVNAGHSLPSPTFRAEAVNSKDRSAPPYPRAESVHTG